MRRANTLLKLARSTRRHQAACTELGACSVTDNVDAIKAYSKALKESDVTTVTRLQAEFPSLPTTPTVLGPWLCMAAKRASVEVLKLLIHGGADPNLCERGSGRNPLGCAASAGHVENVRYLLGAGAAVDISSATTNPLWGAVYARSIDMAMLLLANGVDTEKRYSVRAVRDIDSVDFAWEWGGSVTSQT